MSLVRWTPPCCRTRLLAFGLFVWASATVAAAPGPAPDGRFRGLTAAEGMGEMYLRMVMQDRQGFLWACTASSLVRYDGVEFRRFRHDPQDPTSLAPGFPQTLLEDRRGRIWVGFQRGGISRFDPLTETFTHFHHDTARPDSLGHDAIGDLLETADGGIWVATGGGLDRLDPETGRATRFVHDPEDPASLAGDDIWALAQDKTGALWIASDNGLDRLENPEREPRRFQHFRHDPKNPASLGSDAVRALLVDDSGRLWAGTARNGVYRYEPATGGFTDYLAAPGALPGSGIAAMVEDHAGALWLATWGGGLVRLDPESGATRRYAPDPFDPESLTHNNVVGLVEDRSGLLWVATAGGGLNVLDLKGKAFRRFRTVGAAITDWAAKDVRSMLQDRRGELWVGTAGGGLLRFDGNGRLLQRFRHDPSDPASLADDTVWALLEDRAGVLWVGTMNGLDRFDPVRRRFVHYSNETVYGLREDAGGRIWVGTWSGAYRFDPKTGGFVRESRASASGGISAVLSIGEDAAGGIWFPDQGALMRLDPVTGERALVPLGSPSAHNAAAPPVTTFHLDTAGTLWVGTWVGLARIEHPERAPRRVQWVPLVGVAASIVSGLQESPAGRFWIGTSAGLVRFDARDGTQRLYGVADGLPSESFAFVTARSPDGSLLFGTPEGLVSFRPDEIVDDLLPPPVAITAVLLGERSGSAGGRRLSHSAAQRGELALSYDDDLVTFEFAALSFRAPQRNRFRYQLEGFEATAHELPGSQRGVSYTNLPPGRYVFRVTAANSDGVWNLTGASLALRILPPWWGTWWFRALAVLSFAGVLLAAHRVRTRSIEIQKRALEVEVVERRHAQDALVRSERQLRLITDALPVLVGYVDADRRCMFLNAAAERWFGKPRTELEGRNLDEIMPAEIRTALRETMIQAASGLGGEADADIQVGDETRRISVTVVPHNDVDGTYLGFYVLAQDITQRVEAEEASRRQAEALAHTSRVLTLGELAAALAHELNQPLTAILSNAQAARRLHTRAGHPPEDVDEALQDIASDATRAGEIIRRLRELARRGESKRAPLDVNAAIRGLEPLLRAGALEHDAVLEIVLAADLPETLGDVIQIQQVLLNLARNATEAMLAVPRGARRLRIRTLQEADSVSVEVSDTGPHLDEETAARLFVPFHTTKPGGLGMGLSISRSIVEAHGGHIDAVSQPQGGLRLRFTIPYATAPHVPGGPREFDIHGA
jgi:PAS domain S-box-containing protein